MATISPAVVSSFFPSYLSADAPSVITTVISTHEASKLLAVNQAVYDTLYAAFAVANHSAYLPTELVSILPTNRKTVL